MVHPQVLEQFIKPAGDFRFAQGMAVHIVLQLQHGAHILRHRELAEDRGFLGQVTQAHAGTAVDRQGFDALAVEQDLPTIGAQQAHDHVERGGLARAVGAQQADHFTFVDLEGDILDHLAAAIGLHQTLNFQTAAHRHRRWRAGHGHGRHFFFSLRLVLGRSWAGSVAGAGAVSASGMGVSIARTRPEGLAAVRLAGPPLTVNTSVRLL
ncbi:hypothetical protein Y695_02332 [Hydrogenophaga sp. T4]|nr:hypothetical protein Y695_02332 [Hydrogenophaga sp. T4]